MLRIAIRTNEGFEQLVLATSYSEITYEQFCQLERNTTIQDERLRLVRNVKALCVPSSELVNDFTDEKFEAIKPFLSFIDDCLVRAYHVPEDIRSINVGDMPWKILENAKIIIKNHLNGHEASVSKGLADIVQLYAGVDIMPMPFEVGRAYAVYFKEQLEAFFESFKKLSEYTPDNKQVQAGIDRFEKYGFFTTLHALAKGDPLKYEELLNTPARVVYNTLLLDYENADYNKRLAEAHKPQ